jgi:hypothetical protein
MISLGSTVGYENNVYTLGLTYNFGAPSRHKQIGTANDLRKALSSLLAKNKSLRSQTNEYDTQISQSEPQTPAHGYGDSGAAR